MYPGVLKCSEVLCGAYAFLVHLIFCSVPTLHSPPCLFRVGELVDGSSGETLPDATVPFDAASNLPMEEQKSVSHMVVLYIHC